MVLFIILDTIDFEVLQIQKGGVSSLRMWCLVPIVAVYTNLLYRKMTWHGWDATLAEGAIYTCDTIDHVHELHTNM